MNHEEQCGIVRDLMPLVIDGVAGEASRQLVEAHLDECPDCRRVMEDMSAEIKAQASDATNEKDEEFIRFCLRLRKGLSWKRMLKIIPVVAVTVVLMWGIIDFAHFQLAVQTRYYAPEFCDLSLDESGYLIMHYSSDGRDHSSGFGGVESVEEGIYYVSPLTTIWGQWFAGNADDEIMRHTGYRWVEGMLQRQMYDDDDFIVDEFGSEIRKYDAEPTNIQVKELRIGSPEEYLVAYRAGDELAVWDRDRLVKMRNGKEFKFLPVFPSPALYMPSPAVPTQSPEIPI
jgi:hypothetical protein